MDTVSLRRSVSLFLVLAVFASLTLQLPDTVISGTILDTVSDDLYLSKGNDYVSVGEFYYKTGNPKKPSFDYSASGIVIANDEEKHEAWVLTAAHVVDKATAMIFDLNGLMVPGAEAYSATQWHAHPGWTGRVSDGYDIGLVKFSECIDDGTGTPLTPAVFTGSSTSLLVGDVVTSVGFGMTGTGLTGAVTYDGKKRAGQNVVDYIDPVNKVFYSDFDAPDGSEMQYDYDGDGIADSDPNPLGLEFLIGPGDSGGGVFVDDVLVGINSLIWSPTDNQPDADYGDLSGHTLVSTFADWIAGVIESPPEDDPPGGGKKPKKIDKAFLSGGQFCTVEGTVQGTTIPEPSTLAMLAISLGALLLLGITRLRSG